MSFSKEKRDAIKHYMLEKISARDSFFIQKVISAYGVTKNTAYRYLRDLRDNGLVTKRKDGYYLSSHTESYTIPLEGLQPKDDDAFFEQVILPKISALPENVIHIWYYCFSEMMNNVIDHSQATEATVFLIQDPINTTIVISDNGVGIFNKIRAHFNFPTIDDAIIELFKGKLTTDTVNHSGEGIFFSSRLMDLFAAISDGKVFSHTNYSEVLQDMAADGISQSKKGTIILMRISNSSNKTTKEIMDQYSDDDGAFIRTRIPLKNIYPTYPVSRSQAKRLANRFESFREIQLDFSDIQEIGQGFAHELFVVYARKHPETVLIPFNANIAVQKMIHHVTTG